MKVDLTEKEVKVILSCITITEDSISNNILMVRLIDKKMLAKINLDNLYIKINYQLGGYHGKLEEK